ncbi:hypothetical protein DFH07DRAFT_779684 [Mycena maculata]|uniref:Uncharacterized protein n=1 Tax=Mycena maculata TaxID=230809 RepID=A0AAD7I6S7_9AGAR|nr:hypothetical protein DFH07DRAFT_779684 [Mycena maculata]
MHTHWVSTDRFRRPRPETKRKVWKPDLWKCILSAFISIAVVLFSMDLGHHMHQSGKTSLPQMLQLRRISQTATYSKRDYADITMGAEVVLAFTSRAYIAERDSVVPFFWETGPQLRAAQLVFRSRLDNDGRCWEIDGGAGTIAVRLSEFLVPTAVAVHQSIQHQLSPRANMAPRRLTVWAVDSEGSNQAESTGRERRLINDFLVSGRTAPKDIKGRSVLKLMDFEFSQQSGVPVQVFPVATSHKTDLIILEVRASGSPPWIPTWRTPDCGADSECAPQASRDLLPQSPYSHIATDGSVERMDDDKLRNIRRMIRSFPWSVHAKRSRTSAPHPSRISSTSESDSDSRSSGGGGRSTGETGAGRMGAVFECTKVEVLRAGIAGAEGVIGVAGAGVGVGGGPGVVSGGGVHRVVGTPVNDVLLNFLFLERVRQRRDLLGHVRDSVAFTIAGDIEGLLHAACNSGRRSKSHLRPEILAVGLTGQLRRKILLPERLERF